MIQVAVPAQLHLANRSLAEFQRFAQPFGLGIACDLVQNDLDWSSRDFGFGELDLAGIADQLHDEATQSSRPIRGLRSDQSSDRAALPGGLDARTSRHDRPFALDVRPGEH